MRNIFFSLGFLAIAAGVISPQATDRSSPLRQSADEMLGGQIVDPTDPGTGTNKICVTVSQACPPMPVPVCDANTFPKTQTDCHYQPNHSCVTVSSSDGNCGTTLAGLPCRGTVKSCVPQGGGFVWNNVGPGSCAGTRSGCI